MADRLFLTMDPSHGEISRAMRNRGVEVFMLPNVGSAIKCLPCNDYDSIVKENVVNSKLNNGDLLAVVASTTSLEIKDAQKVVNLTQGSFMLFIAMIDEYWNQNVLSRSLFVSSARTGLLTKPV